MSHLGSSCFWIRGLQLVMVFGRLPNFYDIGSLGREWVTECGHYGVFSDRGSGWVCFMVNLWDRSKLPHVAAGQEQFHHLQCYLTLPAVKLWAKASPSSAESLLLRYVVTDEKSNWCGPPGWTQELHPRTCNILVHPRPTCSERKRQYLELFFDNLPADLAAGLRPLATGLDKLQPQQLGIQGPGHLGPNLL